MATKPHLNMIVTGHIDNGKSTTMGHFLMDLGVVDERTIAAHGAESEKTGKGDTFKYAWVMDNIKDERERGITIDLAFQKFESSKYFFTLIDAPGHRDFIKNMITGASEADAAILVLSAKEGETDTATAAGGQAREHAFLLKTLGVKQIIVAINKMDLIEYSESAYEKIKADYLDFIKDLDGLYDFSHSTLQRDLNTLEDKGLVDRVHGAVRLIENSQYETTAFAEPSYKYRTDSYISEKKAIAKALAKEIDYGDVVYITHGTTTMQIVNEIDKLERVTIITDGLDIVMGCRNHRNVNVLTIGGMVNYDMMRIEHDPLLLDNISKININKLVMGVAGISIERGITFYDNTSFRFLSSIIDDIEEIIVVAHSEKIGKVALTNFVPLDKIDKIITDSNANDKQLNKLRNLGIEIVTAQI